MALRNVPSSSPITLVTSTVPLFPLLNAYCLFAVPSKMHTSVFIGSYLPIVCLPRYLQDTHPCPLSSVCSNITSSGTALLTTLFIFISPSSEIFGSPNSMLLSAKAFVAFQHTVSFTSRLNVMFVFPHQDVGSIRAEIFIRSLLWCITGHQKALRNYLLTGVPGWPSQLSV